MKIERVTPFLVDRCLLVRVYTDEGIVGTGEAGLWAYHKLVRDALGKPVYQLLGGKCRDKINTFANVTGDTIERRAESAQSQVEKGYTSLRTLPLRRSHRAGEYRSSALHRQARRYSARDGRARM